MYAPVCEGYAMPLLTSTAGGLEADEERCVLVCPWHGWEFDLRTGLSVTDPRRRLRRFQVEEREGALYVSG